MFVKIYIFVKIFVFEKIDIFYQPLLFFQPFLIKTFELSSVFCLAFTLWPCIVHFVFQSLNNILIENININIHLPKYSVFCLTALFRVGSGVINVINYDTGYFRYCTDQCLKDFFVPIPIAQSVPTLLLDFPHLGVHQHQHTSPHSGIIIRKSLRHQIIMPS